MADVLTPPAEPDAAANDREPSNIRRARAAVEVVRTIRTKPAIVVVRPRSLPSSARGRHG